MRLDFWDEVDCLALVLVYNLGVNLSCLDIGVAKKFGDGVEVCSVGQCEGCEGVACDMKCDVLVNAGLLYYYFEADICISWLIRKIWEYKVALLCFALFRKKCDGVLGEWNSDELFCLFHLRLNHG